MNGVNLKAVQELLGRADLKMTRRCAHLSQAHLKEALATLNNFGYGHKLVTKAPNAKGADACLNANPS
jgi:hypothetical protein